MPVFSARFSLTAGKMTLNAQTEERMLKPVVIIVHPILPSGSFDRASLT